MVLFSMLMLARSVHGRELALSPMECQINTQSTPDAIGLSKIVTLVRHTHIRSLRHGVGRVLELDAVPPFRGISSATRFRMRKRLTGRLGM
jgi:hypothetical protein